MSFADRLTDAIATKGSPCVVNIDPVYERLPDALRTAKSEGVSAKAALDGIQEFCQRVIRTVAPFVPSVKLNVAYFERYRAAGLDAYDALVDEAARLGLIVIGDVKRGDVGHTASMYAQAQFEPEHAEAAANRSTPDAVTISGYFGWDGVKPFLEAAQRTNNGLFVLVRTSNPSAAALQDIPAHDGRKFHEIMASLVAEWAEQSETTGQCGYSSVGAVVATRSAEDAARLRAAMPKSIFLVPGDGAQGGSAEDFVPYFHKGGGGALVAAGRSVIFAHQQPGYAERFGSDWERCVEEACRLFVADIARVLPM